MLSKWIVTLFRAGLGTVLCVDLGWAAARPNEGPAMYWYGWIATMLIGSTVVGGLAMALPRRISENIPLFLIWLLPLLVLPILAYALMPFWTR